MRKERSSSLRLWWWTIHFEKFAKNTTLTSPVPKMSFKSSKKRGGWRRKCSEYGKARRDLPRLRPQTGQKMTQIAVATSTKKISLNSNKKKSSLRPQNNLRQLKYSRVALFSCSWGTTMGMAWGETKFSRKMS